MSELLDTVEVATSDNVQYSIIWMHGLGADANDFVPIVPELRLPADIGVRFVFPNAPIRPITINNGMAMRSWYDILVMDLVRVEDARGIRASETAIHKLIARENARRFERKQLELVDLDDHPQPQHDALHSEQEMENEWLHRHIARLPEEYQEPLLLQVVGGFSGEEIAEMLGLNKNTVMTRLFRARNQIKEAMEQKNQARGHGHG